MLRRILMSMSLIITGTQGLAAPATIADITVKDELGYECIAEEHLEEKTDEAALAFQLMGKLRMPRTCLPDPCKAALAPRDLSNLTGTSPQSPRFGDEWDEYYARYAEHCRAETTPFVPDGPRLTGEPPKIAQLVSPPRLTAPPILLPPTDLRQTRDRCNARNLGDQIWLLARQSSRHCKAGGGIAISSGTSISEAPLPAPIALLVGGLWVLRQIGRRRS